MIHKKILIRASKIDFKKTLTDSLSVQIDSIKVNIDTLHGMD
jgi:hypothetical protein